MKKLSIITINLNNSAGLEKTIQSVSNQLFKDYEYIIIDGGSTDQSVNVISAYNQFITYWISEYDNGIYHAMNKGIRMACGEYCLFLNSGDWLTDPNILERVFQSAPDADILSGDIAYIDTASNQVRYISKSPEIFTAKTIFIGTLPHQATFIRRCLFDKYGMYDETLQIASDWLFFMKTLLENHVSYAHYEGLISYFNMEGISSRPGIESLSRQEQQAILREKYPDFIPDYFQLKELEVVQTAWETSKEYQAFKLYKKTGIIWLGTAFIRVSNLMKRYMGKITC